MFTRAPRPEKDIQKVASPLPEVYRNMNNLLHAAEYDSELIKKKINYYSLREAYKAKGEDLDALFSKRSITTHRDAIVDDFIHAESGEKASPSKLMETLPLFANKKGRLGDYIQADVTKTARQDDQGNTFIDLVVSIDNAWLREGAPKELQATSPAKMTFLVDTTVAYGDVLAKKLDTFKQIFLKGGELGNVLAYQDSLGSLGVSRPKLVVAKTIDYVEKVGNTLGDTVVQEAGDKFSITSPKKFDEAYRDYFLDFVMAMAENASFNVSYLRSLSSPNQKHLTLIKEYEKVVAFANAYKKTPTVKSKA